MSDNIFTAQINIGSFCHKKLKNFKWLTVT